MDVDSEPTGAPGSADEEGGPPRPALGLLIAAPVAGVAGALSVVPDPVFAQALVGPGAAIQPEPAPTTAIAPITGTLIKLKPHAFVVLAADGRAVLVHLGIDTVELGGAGFRLLAAEGDEVSAGTPLVGWDPARVAANGRSPICPVIALDAAPTAVRGLVSGPVLAGSPLFRWQ